LSESRRQERFLLLEHCSVDELFQPFLSVLRRTIHTDMQASRRRRKAGDVAARMWASLVVGDSLVTGLRARLSGI
jgi:hypothetical protein